MTPIVRLAVAPHHPARPRFADGSRLRNALRMRVWELDHERASFEVPKHPCPFGSWGATKPNLSNLGVAKVAFAVAGPGGTAHAWFDRQSTAASLCRLRVDLTQGFSGFRGHGFFL